MHACARISNLGHSNVRKSRYMSTELSFGEQAAVAIEEAAEQVVEPYMINADLSWLPACGAGLVVIVAIFAVAVVWLSKELDVKRKVLRTITTVLWATLFVGLEVLLATFASAGHVVGASALFVACCVSVAGAGVLAAVSRTRNLIDWSKLHTRRYGVEENIACASSFWGSTSKTLIEVSEPESPNAQAIENKYSRMLVHKSTSDLETARHVVFRMFYTVAGWLVPLLLIAGVSVLCYMFIELPSNPSWSSIAEPYVACELSIIAGVVAGCWLVSQRRPVGFVIPMIVSLAYGAAEFFVETFKGAAIMPGDLRSMNTGMAVAGGYDYELNAVLLVCIALFALAAGALTWVKDPLSRFLSRKHYVITERYQGTFLPKLVEKKQHKENVVCLVKNAIACVLSVLLGAYVFTAPINAALATDWEEQGIVFDYWQTHSSVDSFGLLPSFINALQLEELDEPEGYSEEEAEQLQAAMAGLYDQYVGASPERAAAVEQFDSTHPNVVMIMNETFADLSMLGGLGVGYEGPLFVNNMNAIAKGSANVSVYGGGTCNSEFEGLTGTSLGLVAGGITPYAIYDLSAIDTIPKQFKALGYDTVAIHPEYATNWGRDGVYPAIGFDEFIDRDAFEGAETSRGHYTDDATYDKVMEILSNRDAPQFVFDLTMMNHGGYETGLIPEEDNVGYDFTGIVDESAAAATNEYLSSIRMSDEDVQHLIDELAAFDEPTMVVFYGDHHPGFSWWFQEGFADRTSDIAYQESMYQTEYFIWSNYAVAGSAWAPSEQQAPEGTADSSMLGPVLRGSMVSEPLADANQQMRKQIGANSGGYPEIQDNYVVYRGDMSPASLMAWTLSYTGAPMTDYEKANFISRWWVQSNNVYGYMDACGMWHPMEEADAVASEDIYEQAMAIIADVSARGWLPGSDELSEQRAAAEAASVEGVPGNIEMMEVPIEEDPMMEPDPVAMEDEVPEEGTTEVSMTPREHQDAVMMNVMRWLAYLNFSSHLK